MLPHHLLLAPPPLPQPQRGGQGWGEVRAMVLDCIAHLREPCTHLSVPMGLSHWISTHSHCHTDQPIDSQHGCAGVVSVKEDPWRFCHLVFSYSSCSLQFGCCLLAQSWSCAWFDYHGRLYHHTQHTCCGCVHLLCDSCRVVCRPSTHLPHPSLIWSWGEADNINKIVLKTQQFQRLMLICRMCLQNQWRSTITTRKEVSLILSQRWDVFNEIKRYIKNQKPISRRGLLWTAIK